jgi:integrase
MAISLRRRGDIWHARGTVRVGRETIHVQPFSTGCSARGDAEAVIAAEEAKIRAARIEGPAGRTRGLTIAECFAVYLKRPGGLPGYELARIGAFNEAMGDRLLSETAGAWRDWIDSHPHHAAATLRRDRNTLLAALRHGARDAGAPRPDLPPVALPRGYGKRVPILTSIERAALLRSYNPYAACPVLLLSEQGLRTQEALQLDWRAVDCRREEIRLWSEDTKSGAGRTVPMTRRVSLLLWGMWQAVGRPDRGTVFLSARGQPYADTRGRDGGPQGGNPLAQAHATACKRSGVQAFRVHDHRHDWAARQIMGGMDLFTLMRLGGWSSLKMVQERYGAVTAEHMREAVRRVA